MLVPCIQEFMSFVFLPVFGNYKSLILFALMVASLLGNLPIVTDRMNMNVG